MRAFFFPYDHIEPEVLVSMPVVQNPASETDGHAWWQEVVKGEHGHPIPLLPPVLRLVVFVAKPFEGNLQQSKDYKI